MEGVLMESNKDLRKSFPETCQEYEREEYSSSPTNDEDVRMHILSQQLAKTATVLAYIRSLRAKGHDRGLIVYVDEQLRHSKRFDAAGIQEQHPDLFEPVRPKENHKQTHQCLDTNEGQLRYWNRKICTSSPYLFDFVITLGGDGTVLFSSWIFQANVPPVIPFSLGSLGFLTPFSFDNYKPTLEHILSNGARLHMRMRFRATVYRAMDNIDPATARQRRKALQKGDSDYMIRSISKRGWCAVEMHPGADGFDTPDLPVQDVHCFKTAPVETFEFLNDLVVDRGPSPYVTMLEVFSDDSHLTTAHADGLYDHPNPWFVSVSRTLNWNQRKHQMGFVTLKSDSSKRDGHPQDTEPAEVDSGEESDIETDPSPLEGKEVPDEEFDIDEHATSVDTQPQMNQNFYGSHTPYSRSDSSSSCAVPIHQNQTRFLSRIQDFSSSQSPDRYGPSGPPKAPGPLSERHMATVDFRLQDEGNVKHASSFHLKGIPSNP
ncbi:NAD(+) kinase [Malassezia nana]|uniref:NAD(+) kinase n=1 Tax=Malassezia nana TaxID=180528 RepID=A0AAF0EGR2_9BASI|nr:NAD(+) kinase [Malassezia nana]